MKYINAIIQKELKSELRQQQSLYGIIVYIAATVFILYLTVGQPDANVWNALFWVTQLFIVINAIAKSFLGESRGRFLYYYTITNPVHFILAKLIISVILATILSLITFFLFALLLGNPIQKVALFAGISVLGSISLSLVFTLLSAIASKAMQQASLMAILGIPLVIPNLMLVSRLSKLAFAEVFRPGVALQITLLIVALNALIIILSVVLFPYLWKD